MFALKYQCFHHYDCGKVAFDVHHDRFDDVGILYNDPLGNSQSHDHDRSWHALKNGELGC